MDEATANDVYDILIEHCGATEVGRENFVYTQTQPDHPTFGPCTEYRFQGGLGFGGKFWRAPMTVEGVWVPEAWYVNCYPEDQNPARTAMIEAANADLHELRTA